MHRNQYRLQMKKLTGKEEIIMELFWDRGELFVRELRELYQDPKPHINTLSTQVRTLDDEGMYGTFARLGTDGTPTFVLLDKDFVVKDVWVGYTEGSIQARIR